MPSKLVNVRLDDERQRRLEEFCEREGVRKSEAMRAALDAYLTQGVPLLSATAPGSNDSADSGGSEGSVDLVEWLSGRSGVPKSLVRQRVKAGRVLVSGVVVTERGAASVPASLVALGVELDGEVY